MHNQTILRELISFFELDRNFLYDVFSPESNIILADEIFVCDGQGIVLQISDTYEKNFGFERESVIGRSVFELEAEGVFRPCISATVIRTGRKVITSQIIRDTHRVSATGIPVFGGDGSLRYVVCFNTITREQISDLQDSLDRYSKELQELRQKNTSLPGLIMESDRMQTIWDTVCQTVNTRVNVLITGETGVGKSVLARAIHNISNRSAGPFIEINCGVIHENLIESELFGYEKGAFTGASREGKIGKIELANRGTLFLDEIGELPLHTQTKLLQLIQDKTIERLSGNKKIAVDFKLVCATNKNLEEAVESGAFRRDLYYRLNVLHIEIPPLRRRKRDIPVLARQFLDRFNGEYGRDKALSPPLLHFLEQYPWPGNVRQLENLMERLVISCQGRVMDLSDLPYGYTASDEISGSGEPPQEGRSLTELLESYESRLILDAYSRLGTSTAVARELGISQPTATRKIHKYGGGGRR